MMHRQEVGITVLVLNVGRANRLLADIVKGVLHAINEIVERATAADTIDFPSLTERIG
ncbi:hypothetical protein D3C87_2015620 [compost metagenome]